MPMIPMAERREVLTRNEGWFGRAPKAFQDAVLSRCEWRVCAAGQTIYQTTDDHADFCGVADGTVDFYSRFGAGDNPLLHIAHEGFWMGYGTVLAEAVTGEPQEMNGPEISQAGCFRPRRLRGSAMGPTSVAQPERSGDRSGSG